MQRELVTVSLGDTLQDAMFQMTENHVTGLPVMDGKSRCVGLISASNADMAQHFNMDTQRWESVRVTSFALEEFGEVKVDEVMSRDLVAVERDTLVIDVAATMQKDKIHRVLVLDENQRLYGIISSFDFVNLIGEVLES